MRKFCCFLSCMVTIFCLIWSLGALAAMVTVFDVKKSLPMRPGEIEQKDYYINAGTKIGFQPGMVVTVMRKIPVHDPIQNKSQGNLFAPVAKVRFIHVQDNVTIARLENLLDRQNLPILNESGILIGDFIDTPNNNMSSSK